MDISRKIRFEVPSLGKVSAILHQPPNSVALFVLGHGSGSNIQVPFMVSLSRYLGQQNIATFRFEYPYSDKPDFIPYTNMPMDSDAILIATIRAAISCAMEETPRLALFIGGHSVSGYMASIADAEERLPAKAVISLGYPSKGDRTRSAHIGRMSLPILFIQGTKDGLGTVDEIEDIAVILGEQATVKWISGASHGFKVEGREDNEVVEEIAKHISDYIGL